ncbi:RNB-domain-containing protein [Dendrothele bispora CBS 962.96]|uniref:RNB-domain-containing protein n=1 Tax=Dendrothele bispora (strain CBS 962.96) TaxID=1314807 RepID=A0A4S8MVF4_DENBC|nr:RNB-domain-containing protein [Dendrothele bispora CBS 962.96]
MSSDKTYDLGTLIEFRRDKWTRCAVIVAQVYVERQHYLVCLTPSGEVWQTHQDDVAFEIPNFVSMDIAESCGSDEIAANRNQLLARVEVLKHLTKFLKSVENAANGISSLQLDVYSIAKSPDPHRWGTITTQEVAHLMSKKPTTATYLAAHQHLMDQPRLFLAAHDFIFSQRFRVRPQANLDRHNFVRDWCTTSSSSVTSFIEKAKKIREAHRPLLDKHSRNSPTKRPASHSWDREDKIILQFLLDSLRPQPQLQTEAYGIETSFICKQIMTDHEKMDDAVTQQLLVELGVIAPWQDLTDLREDLDIDVDGVRMKRLDDLVGKKLGRPTSQEFLGPEDFYPSDPSESFRHDFGDMPVYVVDDPSASELDDGISIEPIPGEANASWIHVHIADPASLIPPSHLLAKSAYDAVESFYLYHMVEHMLPPSLTHHPKHGLSLGALPPGESRRVLTYSAKVHSNGDISDYRVRPGLVKNIIVTSYDSVEAALGIPPPPNHLPFGDTLTPPLINAHTDFAVSQFKLLKTVADSMVQRRMRDGVFIRDQVDAQLFDLKFPSIARPTLEPSLFTGFPPAKYRTFSVRETDSGARSMVSECMKIACRVASRFCTDRDIPVLRRYATRPVATSDSAFQTILDNRSPNGYVDSSVTSSRLLSETVAGYSTEPRQHYGNGIAEGEGYVRVTSPLRRYTDLMTAWQIHASIQGKPLPFSMEWMKDFCVVLKTKERLKKRADGLHRIYWAILFIQRWMEQRAQGLHQDKPDPLVRLFARTVNLTQLTFTRDYTTECLLPTLGIKAVAVGLDEHTPPGTLLPVEVTATRIGARPQLQVTVKASG